jgi:hypothetical protein
VGTAPPPPPDDDFADVDPEDLVEEGGLEPRELDDDAFRTIDGAQSDEPVDPAMAAVIEGGGGVAEGFEQSEALLVDNASQGPIDGTDQILEDAGEIEPEPDRGVYAEADEEDVSEDDYSQG